MKVCACVCVITREGQESEFHTEKYSQVKPLNLHVNFGISNPPISVLVDFSGAQVSALLQSEWFRQLFS